MCSACLRNKSSLELRPKKDDQDGPGKSYVQRYDQSSQKWKIALGRDAMAETYKTLIVREVLDRK